MDWLKLCVMILSSIDRRKHSSALFLLYFRSWIRFLWTVFFIYIYFAFMFIDNGNFYQNAFFLISLTFNINRTSDIKIFEFYIIEFDINQMRFRCQINILVNVIWIDVISYLFTSFIFIWTSYPIPLNLKCMW